VITRKGGKVVTIPLAPRTARAIDLDIGECGEGPIFLTADGRRLDRHGAARIVGRIARRAGITKPSGRTHCGTPSSQPRLMPESRCVACRKPRPTQTHAPARTSLDRHATYVVAAYVAGAARQNIRRLVTR
jgi:integrase/recombinase XerD